MLVLSDPSGKVYAETALSKTTATQLIAKVNELKNRKKYLEEAYSLSEEASPENAKKISENLTELGTRFSMARYPDLIQKVIEFDPENQQGLVTFWEEQAAANDLQRFNQIYTSIAVELWNLESAAEKVALLESTATKYAMTGNLRQMIEMQIYRAWAVEKNYPKMLEVALSATELAPDTKIGKKLQIAVKNLRNEIEGKSAKKAALSSKETQSEGAENKETENKETENKETENKETENKETENKETENKETEDKETEDKETEDKETEDKETEDKETEDKETRTRRPRTRRPRTRRPRSRRPRSRRNRGQGDRGQGDRGQGGRVRRLTNRPIILR